MGLFGSGIDVVGDAGVRVKVLGLIQEANEEFVIVSPYVDMGDNIVREIVDRVRAGVRVALVFRRDKEAEYLRAKWFAELQAAGVALSSVERLHSKVLLSDVSAMLGSANFVETSWSDSRELCAVFERDSKEGNAIADHVQRLRLDEQPYPAQGQRPVAKQKATTDRGHCIGCGDALELNPDRPSCRSCYGKIKAGQAGVHCHACGKSGPTSLDKPLCRDCWKRIA